MPQPTAIERSLRPSALCAVGALALGVMTAPLQAQSLDPAPPTFRETVDPNAGIAGATPIDPTAGPAIAAPGIAPDLPDDPERPSRTLPNYGKPPPLLDKRRAYPGAPKAPRPSGRPLPATQPYESAPAVVRRGDDRPRDSAPNTPYAQPQQFVRKPRPKLEADPYAPLGLDVGSLRLKPFVEVNNGYDSNPNRAHVASKSAFFTRFDAGFGLNSNWSAHELVADVRGAFTHYYGVSGADRPEGTGRVALRLDATRDVRIDLELRGTLSTQRPGSPEVGAAVTGRPTIATIGASVGVTRLWGRLETGVTLLADRTMYQDGVLSSGTVIPLSRDDYNAFGLRGRIAYEITPGIKPFVDATVDARRRDNAIDGNGYARNSNGVAARLGTSFELSRILTGDIAVGYAQRNYVDDRLPTLRGPTIDGSLVWSATPLTTLTLRGATLLNETVVNGASGSMTRRVSLEATHALMRNLTITGTLLAQNTAYRGVNITENLYTAGVKVEYALTRSVVVKGSISHERLLSTSPGSDYTANVYLLGLRLQK